MSELTTEQRNLQSSGIDQLSSLGIVELMNREDALVAEAISREKQSIAQATDVIAECFRCGGRLFYIGAGTSGRLGVLDASECPPTFNTPPEMVVGVIAGGSQALTRAIEGAEDDLNQAGLDLAQHNFGAQDVLVGIATSGRTPYVLGALHYARCLGAQTIGFTCNRNSALHACADIVIAPIVGPEILSGSTRLKAGTATKMVLNMLSTGAMILIGKTYGNLMVDLRASNSKLRQRSLRIVAEVTGLSPEAAAQRLQECGNEVKTAIVAQLGGVDAHAARRRLNDSKGKLRDAIGNKSPGEIVSE